jgi:signal transduction histidine kinase
MDGAGTITISATEEAMRYVVEVQDTGKGIAKNHFSSVFQPGFTTKQRGWGLGLSLAKRIIEEYHRGRIFVKQSELGRGTTFRIELRK